jgi:hypothetical protein
MADTLFIVRRDLPAIQNYLAQAFSRERDIVVIFDRRTRKRRQRDEAHAMDHRLASRRRLARVGYDLQSAGFSIVQLNDEG